MGEWQVRVRVRVSWAEGLRQLEGGAGLRELLAGY